MKKAFILFLVFGLLCSSCGIADTLLLTAAKTTQPMPAPAAEEPHPFAQAAIGDYIFFGAYEQDNNITNGKEAIEWLVLAKDNNRLLIISKYALDCQPFNSKYSHSKWENSSLRNWLNNDFIHSAFNDNEKALIPFVSVSADPNPQFNTDPGNTTYDKIFLLSATEASKYFSSETALQCEATKYAVKNNAIVNSSNACNWWLRSPGNSSYNAANVNGKGAIDSNNVTSKKIAIRPVLWIVPDGHMTDDERNGTKLTQPTPVSTPVPTSVPTPTPAPLAVDKNLLTKAAIGDSIVFGAYEQDNITRNGKEPIEWRVLDIQKDGLLVISRYGLDCKPYYDKMSSCTWENSALRSWLNQDFLNAAFSSEEQAMIPTVTVIAHENSECSTNAGNNTRDKIFLLSIPETRKYFTYNKNRQCEATTYAQKQGVAITYSTNVCDWWLRSPGNSHILAAYVNGKDGIKTYGILTSNKRLAVRPAMWIYLGNGPLPENLTSMEQATATPTPGKTSNKATPKPTSKVTPKPTSKPTNATCSECGGDGKITVSCNKCGGAGKLENYCFTCLSSGFHKCTNCSGKGTAKCSTCGGDAKIMCPYCHGNKAFCDPCGWKGFEWCSACYRTGISTCTKCHGIGKVACSSCNGRGRNFVTCSSCNGGGKVTKKCTKCQ